MKLWMRHVVTLLVCLELGFLCSVCLYGEHGWYALHVIERKNTAVLESMWSTERKIAALEEKIKFWHKYSFFTEQIAREKLNLACPDDIIFYYS